MEERHRANGIGKKNISLRPLPFALCFLVLFSSVSPAYAMGRKPKELKPFEPKIFSVHMKVDFGPANKPSYEEELIVEEDTTAKEAVSQIFPVMSGKVCCSLRDVMEIGGVRVDPEKNWWWMCFRNGSKNFSVRMDKLQPGDRIEWRYVGTPAQEKKA